MGWAFIAVAALAACSSLRTPAPPAPQPGVALAVWEADADSGIGKVIWARNDTTVDVRITSLRLFDCRNVRPACGDIKIARTVARGTSARVLTLRAEDATRYAGTFMYKFDLQYEWVDPGR